MRALFWHLESYNKSIVAVKGCSFLYEELASRVVEVSNCFLSFIVDEKEDMG